MTRQGDDGRDVGGRASGAEGAGAGGKEAGATERVRDRLRTQHRIVRAVGEVLAEKGFGGLKVTLVARQAGVDKVLIYRYFGGLDELLAAYAAELDFWPSADEVAGYDEGLIEKPVWERTAVLVKNLARAIYRRPLTREIVAWRLAEQNELTRHLDGMRISVTRELLDRFYTRDELAACPQLVPTLRVVANGVLYLVVGQRNNAVVAEPELTGRLDDEDGWALLDATVDRLMMGALG